MRYVAAYLLAVLGGNENPTAADIEKILGSVGIDVDEEKLSKVISELKGKNISEVCGTLETLSLSRVSVYGRHFGNLNCISAYG